MKALLATVGAYTAFGVVLISGVEHARRPGTFRDFVAQQKLWSAGLVVPVVSAVTFLELTISLAGITSIVVPGWNEQGPPLRRPALLAACFLYLAFGLYGVVLFKRRPGVPCACSPADHPANLWVPVRAFALMGGCLYAAVNTAHIMPWSPTVAFLLSMLASACFVVLAWNIPAALHSPGQGPSGRGMWFPRARRQESVIEQEEARWISRPAR
jgi:hypothetical protein